MLSFNGIDHININVKNLKESTNWYKKIFGFEEKESGYFGKNKIPYSIIGISNKAMLCMYEVENLEENKKSHIVHIGFSVKFVEDIITKLQKWGAEVIFYHESGIVNYPNSQSIYIKDPSGYEIELSSSYAGKL